jgi:hypothetical protein
MKANETNPILIEVTAAGMAAAYLTPAEFRAYAKAPPRVYIEEDIARFNVQKSVAGEPVRARQVVNVD